jgi:hypothetical protein
VSLLDREARRLDIQNRRLPTQGAVGMRFGFVLVVLSLMIGVGLLQVEE